MKLERARRVVVSRLRARAARGGVTNASHTAQQALVQSAGVHAPTASNRRGLRVIARSTEPAAVEKETEATPACDAENLKRRTTTTSSSRTSSSVRTRPVASLHRFGRASSAHVGSQPRPNGLQHAPGRMAMRPLCDQMPAAGDGTSTTTTRPLDGADLLFPIKSANRCAREEWRRCHGGRKNLERKSA
jgi:hypothetical protein